MLSIDESNEIVRKTIYDNMTTSTKVTKTFEEFGHFKYAIYLNEDKNIKFCFNCDDFEKIYEYSGKEFIENDLKNMTHSTNQIVEGMKFSVVFIIDIQKYDVIFKKIPKDKDPKEKEELMYSNEILKKELEVYANEISESLSKFRVNLYSSVIKKMFSEITDKKNPSYMILKVNKDNNMYLIPSSDKITLSYGINFSQKTDKSLARVFLQELEDTKRQVRGAIEPKYCPDTSKLPIEMKDIEKDPSRFSNGFVLFNLYVKNSNALSKKLGYLINFRYYVQFHIHSIKTFLHIRMNKISRELENKLSSSRIIPNEYLKSLETMNFYTAWEKKEEEAKLFYNEVKKVNV